MLKGITLTILFLCTVMCPFFASESVRVGLYSYAQDSTKVIIKEPDRTDKDTISGIKTYRQAKSDSVFSKSVQSDKQVLSSKVITSAKPETIVNPEDTSSTRLYINIRAYQQDRTKADNVYFDNFLLAITEKKTFRFSDSASLSKQYTAQTSAIIKEDKPIREVQEEEVGFTGTKRAGATMNWLPGLLLLSLFIFSWIKMLYIKYVTQVVISLVNYQVALRLLREKNVLFRNMAFGLNIVFAINAGLFIFFLFQYFDIPQLHSNNILSVIVYSVGVIILFNVKTLFCLVLGYIFKVQDEFSEYVHNVNLFNKNIGLFLFPIVILFPYINIDVKPVILFIGIAVVLIMFLLSAIRGFQIIMRKGISLFYLILYLCAVEILPVLIAIKYSSTLI